MKKLIPILIMLSMLIGCLSNEEDKDGDGLIDEIEIKGWEITVVYPFNDSAITYEVFPDIHKKDTDGDGLTDFQESPYYSNFPTDPTKKDTDGDGLTDYEEKVIFKTDPLDWRDDADGDNFPGWRGDYEEILYYRQRGYDNETIKMFLKNPDVDGDGAKDGNDIDPLKDLKMEVKIERLIITSDMDEKDGIIECIINISVGTDWKRFPSHKWISIIPGENETLNLSCILDINDEGMIGNDTKPFWIEIIDLDKGEGIPWTEMKILDEDMLPDIDIVKIDGNSSFIRNINIPEDFGSYKVKGEDGELWFEIKEPDENP